MLKFPLSDILHLPKQVDLDASAANLIIMQAKISYYLPGMLIAWQALMLSLKFWLLWLTVTICRDKSCNYLNQVGGINAS